MVDAMDRAVFDAVAGTATPNLDRLLVGVSNAANYSRLWMLTAAVVAAFGGGRGRRAAGRGVLAIAVASAVTNLCLKPLAGRRRPDRAVHGPVSLSRRVRRPMSTSFPSGHAASAFAFAYGLGAANPAIWGLVRLAGAAVAYSRVHTGVHYPSDVVVGAVVGGLCGWTVRRLVGRRAACPAASG
ncbi:MAG TPA: phosphatase PAP2 family protein [Nonomuraea sp.]|nr:phosphatase PAP2 family protein [Nonomuraea sp.]